MSKPITEQQKRFNDFKTELTALSLKYDIIIEGSDSETIDLFNNKTHSYDFEVYFDQHLQKYI